jgi:glycosyltransferase involved in cell wall biosynthesis
LITIDARWLNASGIGTYLCHIIPGIVDRFGDRSITLLGNTSELSILLDGVPKNCFFVDASADMYSISEQIAYARLIPRNTRLYFATHYNIPLLYNGHMLVMVYDMMHLAMPQFVRGYHKHLYAKLMFEAVRFKANSILTISEFTKQELIRLRGEFSQPIIPIHLGVDESWYSMPLGHAQHPRPYVLYVGNIKPHKNLKALVKAFGSIVNKIPHDLIMVGKREGFITGDREVYDLAQSLGDRVHFTGRVTNDQLHQYLHWAEALVFPSLYEGFGLPPLEAMAAGCPVIVSTAASLPEICGDAALYFDPYSVNDIADKLMMVLKDPNLRASLRQRGHERARTFTWDRCIGQTCDVIQKVLKKNETSAI